MAFCRAWLAVALVLAVVAPSLVFGAPPATITYTKAFTVTPTGGTQCGTSFSIPITDSSMGGPLANWLSSATMTLVPVTAQASIYSIGITPTIAVPSGQWNFLGVSVIAGGITGRIIPKGAFASSCGTVAADVVTNNELIAFTVDENTVPAAGLPFFTNAATATTLFPVSNGAAQPLPAASGHYLPSPLNKFDATNNPNPVWASVPFFPAGVALDSTTTLATVLLDTNVSPSANLYPVCWSSFTVTVTVVLCPTYSLTTSFTELPALAPWTPPVNVDETYRGSFITWRQQVPTSQLTDQVQVDIVTSWAKGTWAVAQGLINTKLGALRVDVFTVPSAGSQAQQLLTTSLLAIDQALGVTPSIGTLWGGLSSITGVPTDVSFPWDSTDSNVLSYDTYVKSIFLTIPGRASVVASRQVRVVISGCCHPTSFFYQDGSATPTPVISAANLPYSIEALMTLEHPSTAAGAANPQFPRSSPELFVPPLVFLGGSAAAGAASDSVAFGGFVPAYNAEGTGTVYSFPVTEVAVSIGGNPLLQNIASTLITVTSDTVPRGILFSASMIEISSLSPTGYVLPEPLTGTTARGVLTQTLTGNVIISTTSYDFIALRRATNIDNSVNEGATCNYVTGASGTLWDAYPKGSPPSSPVGISARASAGTLGYVGGQPLEWGFAFSQVQQCGNQLDVTMLRSGSTVSQSAIPTSITTIRVANTQYAALYFLATDTNQNILPVVHDAPAPTFPDTPQALAGLEVLAVSQIGFPKRTVPVSSQYPSGTKILTRERMGISYCYSRAVFKCDGATWVAPAGVVVTPASCVSPPTDPTCADGMVAFTPPAATVRGAGTYVFSIISVDSATGISTFMGTTSVAAGSTGQITGLKVPSATSSVKWYTQDPAGCIYSGAIQLDSATVATSVVLSSVTQPLCNGAGAAVGGSATVVITSPTPLTTASYTFSNVVVAPGQSLTAAGVALTSTGANTYTLTTGLVVGGYVTQGIPGVLSVTVGGATYKLAPLYTTNIGSTALTVSIAISNSFVAVATPSIAVASYQWTLAGSVQPVTIAALQLDAGGANAGQTLTVLVTTTAGCFNSASIVVPGAGAAPSVTVNAATPSGPLYTDSCYSVALSFTGNNGVAAGTPLIVSWRYCAQPTAGYAGGTPTAANCQTWGNWVNMVCPKFIGIQSTTPQLLLSDGTLSGFVLLQFQATASGMTAFGSTTVAVNYGFPLNTPNTANGRGSWSANGLARAPNCGSTTCAANSLKTS